MTASATAVHTSPGRFARTFTVTKTADGDTGLTFNHNLPNVKSTDEIDVKLTPIKQAPAALSAWAWTGTSTTQITLTSSTATGSGDSAAQLHVTVTRRHGSQA